MIQKQVYWLWRLRRVLSNLSNFWNKFKIILDRNLLNFANEIANNMRSEINNVQGLPKEWLEDLSSKIDIVSTSIGSYIGYKVGLINRSERAIFIAFISNYGMGSAADKQSLNPYLKLYKSSSYYNTRRGNRMFIYTRSDDYYDVDKDMWVTGSASNEKETRKLPSWYNNHPAFHWFENSLILSGLNGNYKIKEIIHESIVEAKFM